MVTFCLREYCTLNAGGDAGRTSINVVARAADSVRDWTVVPQRHIIVPYMTLQTRASWWHGHWISLFTDFQISLVTCLIIFPMVVNARR